MVPPSYSLFVSAYDRFQREADRYASPTETMIDLLTDAMHHAEALDVDFDDCLRIARGHFVAEKGETE